MMSADFGSVLDRLQGLLGKGYLLAGVVPTLVCGAMSGLIGYAIVPEFSEALTWFGKLDDWRSIALNVAGVLVLASISFLFWSLNPVFHRLFAGAGGKLANDKREKRKLLNAKIQNLSVEVLYFRSWTAPTPPLSADDGASSQQALPKANSKRNNSSKEIVKPSVDVVKMYVHVDRQRDQFEPISFSDVRKLVDLVSPEVSGREVSEEMQNILYNIEMNIFPYARSCAELAYHQALSEREAKFPREMTSIVSTRFGNQLQIQREYALTRYGIDSQLFGIHFLKATTSDPSFQVTLEQGKMKLDVSVAMSMMFAVTALGWLSFLAYWGSELSTTVAIAIVGFSAAWVFYEAAVNAQRGMTELVCALIDNFRFDVLRALHIAPPVTDTEERILWLSLVERTQNTGPAKISYVA